MKKTLFLLAIFALVSCKKTSEDPKPSTPTSKVTVQLQAPDNAIYTYTIKSTRPFTVDNVHSTVQNDTSAVVLMGQTINSVDCKFAIGSKAYVTSVKTGIILSVYSSPGTNYTLDETFTGKLNYQFVVQ